MINVDPADLEAAQLRDVAACTPGALVPSLSG
jgi:hypothetical protein